MTLGEAIEKEFPRIPGMNWSQLANRVGKSRSFLSQIKQDKRGAASAETIRAITTALGLPDDHFSKYLSARSTGRLAGAKAGYTVPLVGVVGAGPAVDDATPGERLSVHELFPGDVVAYIVRGRSMEADGMYSGDYVLVRRSPEPDPGEQVVAWVKSLGGTVLKRYKGRAAKKWLESPDGWRHDLTADDHVYGVYEGVIRKGRR